MDKWTFPEYGGYRKEGRNAIEIDNRESPIQTFVREICQNSADAAEHYPVRVEFNEYLIDSKDFPDLEGIRHVLECCKKEGEKFKHNQSTKDYYESCLDSISSDKILMLRISDFNTSGLTGSREEGSNAWNNITMGSGISDKTGGSAGSHGRGKDSFFEISSIRTVFFSTLDKEGIEASIGISKQMTFYDGGIKHDSFGCYLDENENHSNKQLMLDPNFYRYEPGTDIYVASFSKYEDDDYQMQLAVIRDFFVMILDKKLIVNINGLEINHLNVIKILESLKARNDEEKNVIDYTRELIDCYLKGPVGEYGNYSLYLAQSEDFFYVTSVRNGMVIDGKFHKLPQDHIIGLIKVDKEETSELLLMSEDISHNTWKYDKAPQQYRQSIKNIIAEMKANIRSQANKMIEDETGPVKEAEGLNRYIPIVNNKTERETEMAKKEFLYDPIRKTTINKRKTTEEKDDSAAATDKEIMPTTDKTDEDDTKPIHPDNENSVPYVDPANTVKVIPGDNEDYKRQFYQINLKEVRSLCTEPSSKKYKVYYKCDKTTPYYLRAFIAAGSMDRATPLDIITAVDEDGGALPIVDGKVGPIEPNGGKRTYVYITIDYPIPCAIQVGGEIE